MSLDRSVLGYHGSANSEKVTKKLENQGSNAKMLINERTME